MIRKTILYDAFTGISPMEKSAVVSFLSAHTPSAKDDDIREAVEYAVKHKPSFGGFILVAQEGKKIVAAIVANRTGMEGYGPKNIFVFVSFDQTHAENKVIAKKLLQKAIEHADGDVALHVEPNSPSMQLYRNLGFQNQYLELRLNRKQTSRLGMR